MTQHDAPTALDLAVQLAAMQDPDLTNLMLPEARAQYGIFRSLVATSKAGFTVPTSVTITCVPKKDGTAMIEVQLQTGRGHIEAGRARPAFG